VARLRLGGRAVDRPRRPGGFTFGFAVNRTPVRILRFGHSSRSGTCSVSTTADSAIARGTLHWSKQCVLGMVRMQPVPGDTGCSINRSANVAMAIDSPGEAGR